ncbi:hypothetical protein PRZ48_001152 [Zasmidium cellare]|uniref:Uncharacterized protein n=1 Tax=Zasmidium cellare TaxID=395010 RepID=A0ABR0F0H6_ZASCE|nr:hypothetical protein PRZ48_001152 [Zasmidium cellare]
MSDDQLTDLDQLLDNTRRSAGRLQSNILQALADHGSGNLSGPLTDSETGDEEENDQHHLGGLQQLANLTIGGTVASSAMGNVQEAESVVSESAMINSETNDEGGMSPREDHQSPEEAQPPDQSHQPEDLSGGKTLHFTKSAHEHISERLRSGTTILRGWATGKLTYRDRAYVTSLSDIILEAAKALEVDLQGVEGDLRAITEETVGDVKFKAWHEQEERQLEEQRRLEEEEKERRERESMTQEEKAKAKARKKQQKKRKRQKEKKLKLKGQDRFEDDDGEEQLEEDSGTVAEEARKRMEEMEQPGEDEEEEKEKKLAEDRPSMSREKQERLEELKEKYLGKGKGKM